jgi:hypothetical protein
MTSYHLCNEDAILTMSFQMKQVGSRRELIMTPHASGALLAEGARFCESVARLSDTGHVPKGVYRYRTHVHANQHEQDCLVQMMVRLAASRHG